jgi:uncharacterized pyridoxal phosphate-containing UPF0001 family protein
MIAEHLAKVRARIEAACRASGRAPSEVSLVAVSKTVPAERCREAVAAGQGVLGENYAQELRDKAPMVPGAKWHFIGPLQRNKVKYVVGVAELIHSVDNVVLALEIAKRSAHLGRIQRCLIQVNIGYEPQKAGCSPAEVRALIDALVAEKAVHSTGARGTAPLLHKVAPPRRRAGLAAAVDGDERRLRASDRRRGHLGARWQRNIRSATAEDRLGLMDVHADPRTPPHRTASAH